MLWSFAAGSPPLAYIITQCHHVSVNVKLRRCQLLLPLDPSSNSPEQQENEAVKATVDRHYIPPPLQSVTIALLPLVSLFKFLLGLNSSRQIPASGFVGSDRWWWGLPTTATAASSGCTIHLLLLSSQYKGDRRGKNEQGLGFVWGFSNQQKRKRDGGRLEWFYGGRRCSGSRWSLVVEWRLAGGAVAISKLSEVAVPSCSLKSGTEERNGQMAGELVVIDNANNALVVVGGGDY
ncbi:unnamed protein product [Lactuca saligna]|uniref:Uncharacterized protein n=1 Tax=Lactuca saligna TaxID=75948 RepID=A0AA35Z7T6_LACSI|nr:unnamed protein product [Lactuca saligna]